MRGVGRQERHRRRCRPPLTGPNRPEGELFFLVLKGAADDGSALWSACTPNRATISGRQLPGWRERACHARSGPSRTSTRGPRAGAAPCRPVVAGTSAQPSLTSPGQHPRRSPVRAMSGAPAVRSAVTERKLGVAGHLHRCRRCAPCPGPGGLARTRHCSSGKASNLNLRVQRDLGSTSAVLQDRRPRSRRSSWAARIALTASSPDRAADQSRLHS